MIFYPEQTAPMGGSGCGCASVVFNGFVKDQLEQGKIKSVLLAATGALLSPTSSFQGENIPGISYALEFQEGRTMNFILSFLIGGFICVIGQILIDKTNLTPARIMVGYVCFGVILGGFGIYQAFRRLLIRVQRCRLSGLETCLLKVRVKQ